MAESQREPDIYDLVVIGGGINGCGIAADAAGRGLSVLLAERDDLASGTSSASSKLIHGGLRYLEHYAFGLVRESLQEREVLLANAPHIVSPLKFVVPHVPEMRSRALIRAGLFLYDHLAARRRIPASRLVDLETDAAGYPLRTNFKRGFAYWDCWVDDARLVVLVARLAARHGARILTRTPVESAREASGRWEITLGGHGAPRRILARMLVNAAGPWAGLVGDRVVARGNRPVQVPVRLVKGSHIVVPRIAGADDAYLLQAADRRVVFLLPFETDFTLIGTTDVAYDGDPAAVSASSEEVAYLLGVANAFLMKPLTTSDVVWTFAGVRPLYDDASDNPSKVTRDYRLELDASPGSPPLLTVVGGKVTTYRRLAEEAGAAAERLLGSATAGLGWTGREALPGGDMPGRDFEAYATAFCARYPGIPDAVLLRLLRLYGTEAALITADARTEDDLGPAIGGGLSEREVAFLRDHEWARTADDVLWRRTKAGLRIPVPERAAVAERIEAVLARDLPVAMY